MSEWLASHRSYQRLRALERAAQLEALVAISHDLLEDPPVAPDPARYGMKTPGLPGISSPLSYDAAAG